MSGTRNIAIVATILIGVATRLFPETLNLTAVGAVCLFSGIYIKRNWLAVGLPLAAYFASDLIVNSWASESFRWSFSAPTYLLFGLTVLLGIAIRQRPTAIKIGTAGVLSAAMFYIVSNFMVWIGTDMYPRTAAGLVECYLLALPFAGHMLLGNIVYSLAIFGAWHYADKAWGADQAWGAAEKPAPQAAKAVTAV